MIAIHPKLQHIAKKILNTPIGVLRFNKAFLMYEKYSFVGSETDFTIGGILNWIIFVLDENGEGEAAEALAYYSVVIERFGVRV